MKVTEHIAKAQGKTIVSFEVIPPLKGTGIDDLYKNIDPLIEFKPPFIDVTASREEQILIDRKDGLLERKITRLRPGTLGICAAIQYKYNVDTVPHILCGGFTKSETEYLLIDCMYLGIQNVMALRGDNMRGDHSFIPTTDGNLYASDLVKQIVDTGKGKYLHSEDAYGEANPFCIGVAGYPEKHIDAPSMQYDLEKLKLKVEQGADYVVTQMFFDNQKYFEFVKKAREMGITVPIIPGIKPIATLKHLQLLPHVFKIDLPETLVNEVVKCKTNQDVHELGIEWAIAQCKELIAENAPVLHFYSMGKSDNIKRIVDRLL